MRYKYSKRSVMRDVSLRLEILDFPVKSMFCAERASSRSIFHRTQFLIKTGSLSGELYSLPGKTPGTYFFQAHLSEKYTALKAIPSQCPFYTFHNQTTVPLFHPHQKNQIPLAVISGHQVRTANSGKNDLFKQRILRSRNRSPPPPISLHKT